jgi:hypothetical protein
MSWSYGQEVMAHEAVHAAAMRERESWHDHHDPNVPTPAVRVGALTVCLW